MTQAIRRRAAGYVVSAAVVAALLAVAAINLGSPETLAVDYETVSMTYDLSTQVGIAILICAAMYAVPLTCFFGAVFITGFAGSLFLAHLRLGEFGATSQIFAIAITGLAWLGLYLRRDEHSDAQPKSVDGTRPET